MFLKRLELHGFKSFGHRTAIDFLPGITIVVGPNGCGKSNVLDAIRWVLGETSAKSLRGAKMGDVVFRGSSSLKGSHFAQVILSVNNERSWLKVDHSEVQVGRRLFTDGEMEYSINKVKARMRDVHDLFMDTGLGAEGYSIIEQGQISNMVAAKPADRRLLFEEAAGISRYKQRREETLRKLVRTEEDLLRLFDIVGEVERTCNSLYRQAKKAQRFRRISAALARTQRHLIVIRYRALKERLAVVKVQLEKALGEFEEANTRHTQAEARQAEASRLVEDFQRRIQEAQQERFDLQAALHREQRRVEAARQSVVAHDERAALLEREIASSATRLSVLESTLTALQEDLGREEARLGEESRSTDETARQLETLRAEYDRTNASLASVRMELNAARARENRLMNDRRVAESLAQRLREDTAHQDETLAALRAQAEDASAQATAARTAAETAKARIIELQRDLAAAKALIQTGDVEKSTLTKKVEEATRAWNQAASRLHALQELEDSFEGFFRGVQVVMRASQSGRLKGIYGVLSNVLVVPKEYELAVEVAIGGSLQDIITLSERDAQEAIRFLKESREGRATFLPLDLLQSNTRYDHLMPIMKRPGVVGLAKDLIQYDRKIEPAVERRLGNTLIVDHLRTAVELQRQGIRNRYVSLEGELVDPSGVMTGGSHQSRGLLSRSREIKALKDDVAALDAKRAAATAELAEAKERLGGAYTRAAALQAELHQAQMAEARAERDVNAAETRAKEARNQYATADARSVQQRVDLQKHEETMRACDDQVLELQDKIDVLDTRVFEHEEQLKAAQGKLAEFGEQVAAGRASLSGLRERVQGMRKKTEELRRDCSSAAKEQTARVTEREQHAAQRVEALREGEAAEQMIAALAREQEGLEARLSGLTQESEARLREAREGVAQVQALLRDRNVKENALREVEVVATELRAQADYLNQEARDEFSQTVEEIAESLTQPVATEQDVLVAPGGAVEEERSPAEEEPAEEALSDDPIELRRTVNALREKLTRLGAVNETAIEEYKTQKERLDFLTRQRDDLIAAKDSLNQTIKQLDETTSRLFHEAYERIRANFQENFRRLFNGGRGDLLLVEDETNTEPGIDLFAQPPGKNIGGSITLMSGGEKAMTAIALMLAMFQFKPSPICILDEIDAPLDDVNCQRLCDAIKEYSKTTQFLIITHNKITMALADTIYGVTMQEPGVSKLVSVKFNQIEESGLLDKTG